MIVSIIEDNTHLRESWTAFLRTVPEIRMVCPFSSVKSALDSGMIEQTKLVLLDINLPDISGLDAIKLFLERNKTLQILIISVHEDEPTVMEAIKRGARGYLRKEVSPGELISSIKNAVDGGTPLDPFIATKIVKHLRPDSPAEEKKKIVLNTREKDVLSAIAEGKKYHEIAVELGLSVDGVRYHVRNVFSKLGVDSRSAAIAKALVLNLLNNEP